MPNLIHSLDAASLALMVNMYFTEGKGINFLSIHDCFAVTPNNVTYLIKCLKLVYIKIYSDDNYLKKFDQGILNSIKLQFGPESYDNKNRIITVNNLKYHYPDVNNLITGSIKRDEIMNPQAILN
jgi:DNA-directed RNA polymerase